MSISEIIGFIRGIDSNLGPNWREWLPETLRDELKEHFATLTTDEDVELLVALLAVLKSDMAWYDEFVFEKVGHLVSGNPVIFSTLQPLTPSEAVKAVRVLQAMKPDAPFGHNVRGYLVATMIGKGITWVPDEWELPEDMNEWLEEARPDENLPPETLRSAYEQKQTYDFVETHLSVVLGRMLVVDEMIGTV